MPTAPTALPGVLFSLLLISTGCITPGERIAVGRVEVTGRLSDPAGCPLAGEEIVLIQPASMKARKQEIDSAFDRTVRKNYHVRRQAVVTGGEGEFHHLFPGFSRDEPFMVIPPLSFIGQYEPIDPELLLLVKTPGLNRLYEVNVRQPEQIRIYDPEIGAFRAPGREWTEERITAVSERHLRPLPDNPAYTQRVDHIWIEIERRPLPPESVQTPPTRGPAIVNLNRSRARF